ncbi:hypothetical protein ACFYKX_14370 [Cytobacillus sp. FJAT-54145]|uniref:Uncharacterized protein n=1 Tax=Cytobacillus spartinae TaxID=3299023 RepID=A0ABW6KC06_9BACI
MKKISILVMSILLVLGIYTSNTNAATNCAQLNGQTKVWWDGIELKPGQIGRLTIKKDTPLFKLDGNKRINSRTLKAGEFYRIYAFKPGLLSVGGGYYVERDTRITYQTPSKSKLQLVQQLQVCTIVNKSRATFSLKDSQGTSYNAYIVSANEQKAFGSFSLSATWNMVWAGISEGDALYRGNYKIYLQKAGSSTITDTGIKLDDYIYNATRKTIYEIPSTDQGQPDLFAVASTESSNFESANMYYVNNGQLFRVKVGFEDEWYSTIFYSVRPYSVGELTYKTKEYNNAEGVWSIYTWLLNPNNAELQLIDSQEEYNY